MKNIILDIQKFKKFNDDKPSKEALWEGNRSKMNLMNLKPGQEIKPHVHDGDHIWVVLEGGGEFLSHDREPQTIQRGNIVVAPEGEAHGVRNNGKEPLVFASITV